jgi:hypothetical protein
VATYLYRLGREVIALLVIAPSKTDRERVIPMSAELFAVIAAIIRRHTQNGRPIPLIQRYDNHERRMSDPMPFLFQRHTGPVPRVISPATVLVMLRRRCAELAEQHRGFRATSFTPHDFRRLLATDLVNNGLPIHIGAALLGHLNLQTTRGYVAVFNEDVVHHYQEFLDRRRKARSADEYKPVTDSEWSEFEEHFDRRKVELGGCARPYGSACQHEHACLTEMILKRVGHCAAQCRDSLSPRNSARGISAGRVVAPSQSSRSRTCGPCSSLGRSGNSMGFRLGRERMRP